MKKIFSMMMTLAIAALTFTSCEDVPMPYGIPGFGTNGNEQVEAMGNGTADSPYNIAALIAFAKNLDQGASSDDVVYFRGKVVSFKSGEEPGNQYGNATFYVSDDGTSNNQFYVYRCKGPGNSKITDSNLFKVGDELVICGKITNYNGTLETEQNTAYIVSINGSGSTGGDSGSKTDPAGAGTEADPFNVAAAIAKCQATGVTATSEVYYVQGIAKTIDASGADSYGNITIDMIDEGGTDVFKAYQILSLNGAKFTSATVSSTVKEGDLVVVKGNLVNYMNNTPETTGKGAAQLVSVNGKGGDNTPPSSKAEPKGTGTKDDPFNAAAANEYASKLASGVNSDPVYVKGKVSRTKDISTQYKNATFYISEDGAQANEFYVFRCKGLDNADITSADDVMVGDDVVIYGPLTNYSGNTPETVQNECYIVSIEHHGTPGTGGTGGTTSQGLNINGTTVTLTASGVTAGTTTTTIDLSTLGYENAADVTNVTFPDGATLTFDKNTNKNAPKYYTATNGVRVYSDNTLTFNGKNTIAVITMECDAFNGVDYVGSKTATVSFDGNTAKYTNVNDGANTQIRIKKVTITYAK